jgi:hypothetical protein
MKMSNIDVLREVFDKGGRLKQVWEARFEGSADFITEMKFCFENAALIVSADSEHDTIVLWIGDFSDDDDVEKIDVSEMPPWTKALDLEMLWGWELTNHQGYSDGIRIEFADLDAGASVEIDLIVAASMLHLCICGR